MAELCIQHLTATGLERHTFALCLEYSRTARLTCSNLKGICSGKPSRIVHLSGILKGFDPLLNLVLDGTIEYMRDPDDQYKLTEDTRQLGLVVCRGTSVVLICPQDGMEAIPNPFIQQQDA
ncbi:U6 snRNA-associated Sm-like protein LSm7 isoform 1-T1 [Trichechus inunguis]